MSLRSAYDQAMSGVQDDLLRMETMIEDAIENAINSLKQRDRDLAQQTIDEDARINEMRFKIEEQCLALIATQQPTASDLRSVLAAMSIVVDMERMGDYATGIAKTVLRMGDEPLLKPLIDLPRMANLAREMLRDCIQAYVDRDVERAEKIAARDDEMDHLYQSVFDELVEIMSRVPDSAARATYLLWCGHNLERIGDRVTNIAERVVFLKTGDIRELND